MTLGEFRTRAAALIAFLAIATQSIWPLIAQAQRGRGAMPVELCSIDGVTRHAVIPVGSDAPAGKGGPGESGHCALCATGCERLGAAPTAGAALVVASSATERPAVAASATFDSRSDRTARSRAPPRSL